jgi:hypothetical protein
MHATVGDHIVIRGHHIGEHDRDCEIVGLSGAGDEPPYLVRWDDSGHESLFFPGPDATVRPHPTIQS